MTILKIEDYNYSIVYVEDEKKAVVYKRFVDGTWMQLNRNTWTVVANIDQLEKLFKEKKYD